MCAAFTEYVNGVLGRLSDARKGVIALQQDITEDWTVFSTCLDLIHTAGVVLVAVEASNDLIATAVQTCQYHWGDNSSAPPFTLTPGGLLKPEAVAKLKAYVNKIGGEISDI